MCNKCRLPVLEACDLTLPAMAVGTYGLAEDEAVQLFDSFPSDTLLIDTAARYGNESEMARALAVSGWDRQDVVIIGKLARSDQEQIAVEAAILQSIARMKCDYIDIYLIHSSRCPMIVDTWEQMIWVKEAGLAKCIGVSNFGIRELESLFEATGVWPEFNQIPLTPLTGRCSWEIVEYCMKRGIAVQAAMPFGGIESRAYWDASANMRQEWLQDLYRARILAIPGTKSVQHLLSNIAAYEPFLK